MSALPLLRRGRAVAVGLLLLSSPLGVREVRADAPAHAAPDPTASAAVALLQPDAAVQAGLSLHPAVRAAEARWLLADGQAREVATLLANPQLSASVATNGDRATASLAQPLSWTGEGRQARRAAQLSRESAEALRRRARLVAAAEVRVAYVDAAVAIGRVAVAREGTELAAHLRAAVANQAQEGEASLLDLRLARLAEVQASLTLLQAQEAEALALRALSALIGQAVPAEALYADPLAAAPATPQGAQSSRFDVAGAKAAVAAARADLQRQEAATWAPVQVGLSLSQEDGRAFFGPSLGLQLPVFSRNQASRENAHGELILVEGHALSIEALAAAEIQTARHRAAQAEIHVTALVEDPLGEARAALSSIEAGYLAGEIDLPSTVLLQRQVLDGEAASVSLFGGLARARLDLLLATEDPALLGGAR